MKKVLVIHNIITPTRTILFNEMNIYFKEKGYSFKVIFTSQTESNRNWDNSKELKEMHFDYSILSNKQLELNSKKDSYFFHLNFDIPKILDKEKPDIIIHAGWAGISAWTSLWWCKKNNTKYILWSESSIYEESWRRSLTKPIVRYLIKKSDNYLSFGTRATEYLVTLGAKLEKIFTLYNTVDIDYFLENAQILKSQKEELKKKYGINTKYALLFVGQFIKRKGIYEILDGFSEFQKRNPNLSLILVGDGPEKEDINNKIRKEDIKNVFFPGFLQKTEISELYTISDIFTLPSTEEVWGLVINEAMCFGLPILTAYKVGASADLIEEGKNGYTMKENSTEEFVKGLDVIYKNGLIENNNSLKIIAKFRIKDMVKALPINDI